MKKIFYKITHWEAWPFKILYAPISLVWVWYIIKSRAVWFFTPSNPKLTFGGMEGEPKKEMYDLLPKEFYPSTFYVLPTDKLESVKEKINQFKITYPFIVKPEVGGQGILLRKIDNEEQLKYYHSKMKYQYIVQQMVYYPIEVSVFHIRYPNKQKGIVTGFLHKIPLQVMGNGKQTLKELIEQHPKASKRIGELYSKHKKSWDTVIGNEEVYPLSYAANHNRGAQFIDLKNEIDDKLIHVFDKISLSINDFFYGRYDIMCNSIDDLKNEKNFTILEYNGCGAEPNHFYDTGYTLLGAYKEILKHWKMLYEISRYNKKQGIKPWGLGKGKKFITETRKLYTAMKKLDAEINL